MIRGNRRIRDGLEGRPLVPLAKKDAGKEAKLALHRERTDGESQRQMIDLRVSRPAVGPNASKDGGCYKRLAGCAGSCLQSKGLRHSRVRSELPSAEVTPRVTQNERNPLCRVGATDFSIKVLSGAGPQVPSEIERIKMSLNFSRAKSLGACRGAG